MPSGGASRGSSESRRLSLSVLALAAAVGMVASTVVAGAAAPGADPPEVDATITAGGNYFVGQVLYSGRFDEGDDVTLSYANGTFVTELSIEPGGGVVVDTGRYGAGDFVLNTLDGESVRFTVNHQRYDVTASENTVQNGGTDTEATVEVRSNRNRYQHVVEAAGLGATTLRRVFGVGRVGDHDDDGNDELLLPGGTTEATYSMDFRGVRPGNYTLEFRVLDTGDTALVPVTVRIHPSGTATLSVREGPLRIQQAAGRTLRGTSSLPNGVRLNVVLRNDGGQGFRRSESVLVTNGAFEATFDLSSVPVGQAFVVNVSQGPVLRDQVRGVVVRPASMAVADEVVGGTDEVTLQEVSLPRGGFVAVVVGGDRVLGTTAKLDPGTYEDVTVPLDEPIDPARNSVLLKLYEDVDGDGSLEMGVDEVYELPDGPVTKVVPVVDGTPTASPTVTPTVSPSPTPTSTPTSSPTSTATPTETETPAPTSPTNDDDATTASGGAGPGFTPVVAVLALAVASLALRRRE